MVSVGYVGTRGVHLTRFRSPNGGLVGRPKIVLDETDVTGYSLTPNKGRLDPRLGVYTQFENSAQSKYHSLQLSAQRYMGKGIQFTAAYTWAHATDDVSDMFDGIGYYSRPQDDGNLRLERASANFDVRHRLAASVLWDLPWSPNHFLLGNWRLAGILTAQTAQPFTVNSAYDVNGDGLLTDRLNSTDGILAVSSGPLQYQLPAGAVTDNQKSGLLARLGENGALGRNTFRARGLACFDFSLFKTFPIGEQRKVEFRTEFYNLFNRTHFGIPVRILEAPGFGRSYNTALNPRQIQFALKLAF